MRWSLCRPHLFDRLRHKWWKARHVAYCYWCVVESTWRLLCDVSDVMLSVYRDLSVGLSSVCTVYPSILNYILGFLLIIACKIHF